LRIVASVEHLELIQTTKASFPRSKSPRRSAPHIQRAITHRTGINNQAKQRDRFCTDHSRSDELIVRPFASFCGIHLTSDAPGQD
jgi:hypothetical protein